MYFFDTHAIMGILKGEPGYARFRGLTGYTHHVNVLEALVHLGRLGDPQPLNSIRALHLEYVAVEEEDLLVAAALKTESRGVFSYVDALGYAIAQRLELPFLTGDTGFRGLQGVEFAK